MRSSSATTRPTPRSCSLRSAKRTRREPVGEPAVTVLDEREEQEDEPDLAAPETRAAGRWNSAGVPTERSKDFGTAIRRLVGLLGPERRVLIGVALVAITSAVLNVLGPRVLGRGTDIIITGIRTRR